MAKDKLTLKEALVRIEELEKWLANRNCLLERIRNLTDIVLEKRDE